MLFAAKDATDLDVSDAYPTQQKALSQVAMKSAMVI